jgi:trehalose utilization protein
MRNMISLCRRTFVVAGFFLIGLCVMAAKPIRVVVWDEQQPAQKEAYTNFLGETIAKYLSKQPGITAKSVGLNDPDQGLSPATLDNCDVLIWWGHQRHGEVKDEHVQDVVKRIKDGKLNFIALHSAHWSKVFIKAMAERAIEDAWKTVPENERANVKLKIIPADLGGLAPANGPLTPWSKRTKDASGEDILEVKLPSCVFPAVHNDGKPSEVEELGPTHPIQAGVPKLFKIPQTEVYAGPFHVPKPDALIFREKWETGETFPAGCLWSVGKGKVFYFRPGHETYPIFAQPIPQKIVLNAVRYLGKN